MTEFVTKDYSQGDLGPKEYNPFKKPSLFTELDPAGLQELKDADGNPITELELSI